MNRHGVAVMLLIVGFTVGYLLGDKAPSQDTGVLMHDESMEMEEDNHHGDHDMSVSNDREFVEGMIPHHQEAVDTALEVLDRGGEIVEVKELAEAIIEAQEREIAEMRVWYKKWYGEEFHDTGVYVPMMRDLSSFSGKELDLIFITDMIVHHEGALFMGHQGLEFSESEEILTLSQNILDTQQVEIDLMRKILSEN